MAKNILDIHKDRDPEGERLPVRIAVQQDGGEIKPGMMVELEARTGD